MSTKQLMLIIFIIFFLSLITAWQQIQTFRWSYRIYELIQLKKQSIEEQKRLQIQLTNLKSPKQLFTLADLHGIELTYPEILNPISQNQFFQVFQSHE